MEEERSDISQVKSRDDSELRRVLAAFAEFTVDFIKTMLYTHQPQVYKKPTDSDLLVLYEKFWSVQTMVDGISYVLYENPAKGSDIEVEGLSEVPMQLSKLLKGGIGNHFLNKFISLFRERHIVSIVFYSDTTKEEFIKFLDLFLKWNWRDRRGPTAALIDFCASMKDAGIFHITFLGSHEIIKEIKDASWQVKVLLSRIRKETLRLKLLSRILTPEQIDVLKNRTLKEIVVSLKYPILIEQLFKNIDKVIEESSVLTKEEAINILLSGFSNHILIEATSYFMNKYRETKFNDDQENEDWVWLIRNLLLEISRRDVDDRNMDGLLQQGFNQNYIKFAELPPHIQQDILTKNAYRKFSVERDSILVRLLKSRDPHEITKILNMIKMSMPELIKNRDVESLSLVGMALIKLYRLYDPQKVPGMRERLLEVVRSAIDSQQLKELVTLTCSTTKDQRTGLELLLRMYGDRVVPYLIKVLVQSEEVRERRAAVDILISFGSRAKDFIKQELRSHRYPWYTIRNLIHVLYHIGDESDAMLMNEFLEHPHPKVREECIIGLEQLLGKAAEEDLLPLLNDKDINIRKQALLSLAKINSTSKQVLDKLLDAVKNWERFVENEEMPYVLAAIKGIGYYDPDFLPQRDEFESVLMDLVKPPSGIKAVLPTLLRIKPPPIELRLTAIETLGYIGSQKARMFLQKLTDSKDIKLSEAAKRALELSARGYKK